MQKNAMRWKIMITCLLSLGLTGCQLIPVEEELPAAPVIQEYEAEEYEQAVVVRGNLVLEEKIMCRYVPAKQESLAFEVSGEYIENIYVTEGQQVQAGQLLAELVKNDLPQQISDQEYQLQVLTLEKEHVMENRTLELQRQDIWLSRLSGKELEKQQRQKEDIEEDFEEQLQEIEDSLYIGELRLAELKEELSKRQIYAGIDGIVTYVRWTEDGQLSVEEQKMITIADMSTTAFKVAGEDAIYFPVGTQVVITRSSGKEVHTAVAIEAASLGVNTSATENTPEEAFQVAYFQLDQPDPTLEEGDSGYIVVELDSREDVLYVDKAALKTADNRQFVYVLNEDGWKVMQDVTTGLETEKYIEITSGLEEGDSVLLE